MIERFRRGWALLKASGSVLWNHPKLAVFPVVSVISIFALCFAIVPLLALGTKSLPHLAAADPIVVKVVVFAILFALYFTFSFVAIFFNAALTYCALQCFAGDTPSIRAGLAAAGRRIPQIAAWTFVASTIGLIIRCIQDALKKVPVVGELLSALLGASWVAITFFVLPVVVIDGIGPFAALKASTTALKKTWGQATVSVGGLGLMFSLSMLPVIGWSWLAAKFGGAAALSPGMALGSGLLVIGYVAVAWIIFVTLTTIVRTGAYVYAITGDAPGNMDDGLFQSLFKTK